MSKGTRVAAVVGLVVLCWATAGQAEDGLTAGAQGVWTPPACQGIFADVPCTAQFAAWVEQFYRDGITSGCTAGNYCPDASVTRRQMAVFVERAMRGTAAWQAHTVEVFAVRTSAGAPDAVASGAALLAGVASIPASGADAPSLQNPWLVRVGPGRYDLGTATLALRPYVTLEGAGREATVVTSDGTSASPATVSAADSSTVRAVGVEAGGASAVAIQAAGSVTIEDVRASALGGTIWNCAINAAGSNGTRISRSFLRASGSDAYGLLANNAVMLKVRDVEIDVDSMSGSSGWGVAMMESGGGTFERLEIDVTASQPNAGAVGFMFGGDWINVYDSWITAAATGSGNGYGLYVSGDMAEVRDSRIWASCSGATTGTAVGVLVTDAEVVAVERTEVNATAQGLVTRDATAARSVLIRESTLLAPAPLVNGASFTARVTGSRLDHSVSNAGTMICHGNWGPTGFLASTCP